MSKILDINKYNPTSSDHLFFDNNVWMFMFGPLANYSQKQQRIYSSFLNRAVSSKSTIYVNSLVLSEFANAFLRLDFEQWKKINNMPLAKFKKDYISTSQYKATVSAIISAIKNILAIADKKPDDFHIVNLDLVFSNFSSIDFNDCYFVEFCKNNSLKLVTDDKDFQKIADPNLTIITNI